jgi:predicted phosphoribosyltransferase
MRIRFRDRRDAGQILAKWLNEYANRPEVLVLALPRGGVPVGFEVARAIGAPLDIFVVRKLGVPGHEELAMGAIACGGVQVLNSSVVESFGIPDKQISEAVDRERRELDQRERDYREDRSPREVRGRTVILVDDGIATGSTVRAAIAALRKLGADKIVVATPTIARSTADEMSAEVDELIAVMTPSDFSAVGQWYDDFSQTTDAEVRRLLEQSSRIHPAQGK